jgi:hypothetical protein
MKSAQPEDAFTELLKLQQDGIPIVLPRAEPCSSAAHAVIDSLARDAKTALAQISRDTSLCDDRTAEEIQALADLAALQADGVPVRWPHE